MNAGADSNAEEIVAMLDKLGRAFDLTRPGVEGSLGEDLLDLYALGVHERTAGMGLDVDGRALEANRGRYGDRKREAGLPVGKGFAPDSQDSMLSLVQLKGTRTIAPDLASAVYSTDQFAYDKANWFTYGSSGSTVLGEYSGARGQPERHFWGFDATIEADSVARCHEILDAYLKSL